MPCLRTRRVAKIIWNTQSLSSHTIGAGDLEEELRNGEKMYKNQIFCLFNKN